MRIGPEVADVTATSISGTGKWHHRYVYGRNLDR